MDNKRLKKIAELLLYTGPSIAETISKAITEGSTYSIHKTDELTRLTVTSRAAYDTKIKDIYLYNNEDQLIKHTLVLSDKTTVLFDKYQEARKLLGEAG